MAIALEGWEGLRAFGGNTYFVMRARSLMQADNLDVIGSHDRINLADVSDRCDLLMSVPSIVLLGLLTSINLSLAEYPGHC